MGHKKIPAAVPAEQNCKAAQRWPFATHGRDMRSALIILASSGKTSISGRYAITPQRIFLMADIGINTSGSSARSVTPMASNTDRDTARRFFIIGLRNIHATVHQGKAMVEAQIDRLEQYPELKAKLLSHRQEKDAQLARVERILSALDEDPSAFKDTAMHAMGTISTAATAMAGDEILKNCFSTIGLASFEAAAYETLVYFAQLCGEQSAVGPLQQSLGEERAMAGFVQEHLNEIATRFLMLKSQDQQASH